MAPVAVAMQRGVRQRGVIVAVSVAVATLLACEASSGGDREVRRENIGVLQQAESRTYCPDGSEGTSEEGCTIVKECGNRVCDAPFETAESCEDCCFPPLIYDFNEGCIDCATATDLGIIGGCEDGGAGRDGGAPDADGGRPMCSASPTYPPTTTDTQRRSVGYSLPDPAASWACTQLAAIPYVGTLLFAGGSSISLTGDAQEQTSDGWKDTCVHESTRTAGAGVTIDICGLEGQGRWSETNGLTDQFCVDCTPPTATCGDLACTEEKTTKSRQGQLSKSLSFPGRPPTCNVPGKNAKQWLNWIRNSINVSAKVGAGWNGTGTDTHTEKGEGTCATGCSDCTTKKDENNVFLDLSASGALTLPSWRGVSASGSLSATGRLNVGIENATSTCAAACGGMNASASATARLHFAVRALGFSVGQSIGVTCQWAKSWSTCPGAGNTDTGRCTWSGPLAP